MESLFAASSRLLPLFMLLTWIEGTSAQTRPHDGYFGLPADSLLAEVSLEAAHAIHSVDAKHPSVPLHQNADENHQPEDAIARSNQESNSGLALLDRYLRPEQSSVELTERTALPQVIPDSWWREVVSKPMKLAPHAISLGEGQLILEALHNSHRIAAINESVCVAQTAITQAAAEFDPTAYVESVFTRTSIPTGSDLDAGSGIPRLREEDFSVSGGVRRRAQSGATIDVGQRIGLRDSNSQFFTPPNQGNSRLTVSLNQPLLRGAGQAVNQSLIVLAQLNTRAAKAAATTEIQDHLLSVQIAHWELYYHRVALLLRLKNLDRAAGIAEWLEHRQTLDSLRSQVKRANSAVASRRTGIRAALAGIGNSEDRLRALVNSSLLSETKGSEIVPTQPPSIIHLPTRIEDAVVTALQHRSEIDQVARELDAVRVRLNLAKNELLPVLDVVLESYLSGLRGRHDIGGSWIDQFSVGEPSYSAGIMFEVPLYRRAEKANVQRRRAQLRQVSNQLRETIASLHAEVATAVRNVDSGFQELLARHVASDAAEDYASLLATRWKELPGDGFSSNSMLEDLLDAQDRLLTEELALARAEVDYAIGTIRLKRAIGTLLQVE
ncbi:MAG: TolC family protein [Planctomycetota bacterium]